MSGTNVAKTKLTGMEARIANLVGPGEEWDEDAQVARPRGEMLREDRLARPLDLAENLQVFAENRKVLLRFVAEQMVEAKYDRRRDCRAGQLGHYYTVPGTTTKALTKRGGEALSGLFRFAAGPVDVVSQEKTPEYVDATVRGVVLDQFGRVVGSAVSSCSTAEPGFRSRGAQQKYGAVWENRGDRNDPDWVQKSPPDYRAALNDVVARARKRCYVQAIIVACQADEIFHAADEDNVKGEPSQEGSPQPQRGGLPTKIPFGDDKGTLIADMASNKLAKLVGWMQGTDAEKFKDLIEACNLELDERRQVES